MTSEDDVDLNDTEASSSVAGEAMDVTPDGTDDCDIPPAAKRRREDSSSSSPSPSLPPEYDHLEAAFGAVDAVLATAGFRSLVPLSKLISAAEHISPRRTLLAEDVARIHAVWPGAFGLVQPARGEPSVRVSCNFAVADARLRRARDFHQRLHNRGIPPVAPPPPTTTTTTRQPLLPLLAAPVPATGGISGVVERVVQLQHEREAAGMAVIAAKRAGVVERLPLLVVSLRQTFAAEHRTRASMAEACARLAGVLLPRISAAQVRTRLELLCRVAPDIVSFVVTPPPMPVAFRRSDDDDRDSVWIAWPEKLTSGALPTLQQRLVAQPSLLNGLVL